MCCPVFGFSSVRFLRGLFSRFPGRMLWVVCLGMGWGVPACAQDAGELPANRFTTHATLFGAGRSSLGGVGIALLDGLVNVLNERLELRAHSAVAHTGLLGGADTLLLRFDVSHFAEFLSSS